MVGVLPSAREPVTLMVTGPLITVAVPLEKAPEIEAKIKKIVWMGGALNVGGNVEKSLEPGQDGGRIEFWQKDSNRKQTIEISTRKGQDLVDTFNIPLWARNFNPCSNVFNSRFDRSRTNRTQLFSLVVAVVNNASGMFFEIREKLLNFFASTIIK